MTFDDGILKIYNVTNAAAPGDLPCKSLTEKGRYYYCYETLGVTRFYQAMQANQQITAVVAVPGWINARVTDICELDDGALYKVDMVQTARDDNNLKITRLSLERVSQKYEFAG